MMSDTGERERFILELEALPDEVPVANRLRFVLKRLLRQFGFKCVGLSGTLPDDDGAEDKESEG